MTRQKKAFIVDDHPVIRDFLRLLLEKERLTCCGEAENAEAALAGIETTNPDIVTVDISLGKGRNGLDLIKDIRTRYPGMPVLVFSMHEEATFAERALRAGATGYVSKADSSESIMVAVQKVLSGGVYLSPTASSKMANRLIAACAVKDKSPMERLSDRELQVLEKIGQGKTSREIAAEMHLESKTVETYRGRIKVKLGLKSAVALHQYALQWVLDKRALGETRNNS